MLDTQHIWKTFGDEFYFFILKRVRDEDIAREVLQNVFLKIHKNLQSLNDTSKIRAWAYQIVRNEIVNFQREASSGTHFREMYMDTADPGFEVNSFCCFEKFIQNLPTKYRLVVQEVYLKGNSQTQAAEQLGLTLANIKARVRRAKEILKENFQACCNYELDAQGKLTGEPDCKSCETQTHSGIEAY